METCISLLRDEITPCRNKRLPGFHTCGIHGAVSMKYACKRGNLQLIKHILQFNENKIRLNEFMEALNNDRYEIISYVIENSIPNDIFFDNVKILLRKNKNLKISRKPNATILRMKQKDNFENFESKIDDCHICQSDNIKVLQLKCCKNLICKNCLESWDSINENSCAFCRQQLY